MGAEDSGNAPPCLSKDLPEEDVASVEFALSGEVLTFPLEVEAARGGTETLVLQNYLRLLDS
jgi:hypothetical protein